MTDKAFILTTVEIKDGEAFSTYRAAIDGLNSRIGGTMLVRGKVLEMLENEGEAGEIVVVIEFPTIEAARAYIASPEYQAARPLRDAAGRFRIRLVG